jgi:serine/threonine protein kinase
MNSELDSLARILGRAGESTPTGRELAELLWLAGHVGNDRPPAAREEPRDGRRQRPSTRPSPHPPQRPPARERPARRPAVRTPDHRVPLHIPTASPPPPSPPGSTGHGHTSLLAPTPPMLAHPLALQRSLRPLRRTAPIAYARELDEDATAHRIAALGARPELWLPVLRPRRERWLHLRLVFDSGPTMAVWRPLLRDLHTAFAQTGAFRTLDVLRLGADGGVPPRHWERGRTAVLVISDCMGPQWRQGAAGRRWYRTLRSWACELPVAVVQPLPERLWRHTALPPVAGVFRAPAPGVPNTALDFTAYDVGRPHPGGIPVPVLEPSADWLGHWASLLASPGRTEIPGAASLLTGGPIVPGGDEGLDLERVGPEELVLRFRSVASPQAFRLAAHLAVGTAHLPVMRLVQAAIERHPQPQHLAEVVLSGMLKSPSGASSGAYDFRPGVREVLLGTLPRSALSGTAQLLGRISEQIESRAGAVPGEFRALVASRLGVADAAPGDPFALLSRESVRLLRGPDEERDTLRAGHGPGKGRTPRERVLADRYELQELIGSGAVGEVWRAFDRSLFRTVAIKFFRYERSVAEQRRLAVTAAFEAAAQNAARVTHAQLVRMYDVFTLRDACCLVMELVEGPTLRQLIAGSPGGLEPEQVADFGRSLLSGLRALHREGILHGDVKPSNILMTQHGSPVLCDFGVEWPFAPKSEDPDHTGNLGRLPVEGAHGAVHDVRQARRRHGTPRYAAPERMLGSRNEPSGSDLYSLGCVLYEMATGAPPFPGPSLRTVVRQHLESVPKPPRRRRRDLPPVLDRLIMDLLAKDTGVRRHAADELASLQPHDLQRAGRPRWRYRLLGSPMATSEGPRTAQQHSDERNLVLCRLLLARGQEVTAVQLREAVGPYATTEPGECAMHLRGLGHDIRWSGDSYWLALDSAELDVVMAENDVQAAEEARRAGDASLAFEYYSAALALWDGVPLARIPGAWADQERERLIAWQHSLLMAQAALMDEMSPRPRTALIVDVSDIGIPRLEEDFTQAVQSLMELTVGEPSDLTWLPLVVVTPVAEEVPVLSLVDWATDTLPLRLQPLVPSVATPIRIKVLLFPWSTAQDAAALLAALPLPGTAGSGLSVSIGVSYDLYGRLGVDQQRDYQRFSADVTGGQIEGRYLTVKLPSLSSGAEARTGAGQDGVQPQPESRAAAAAADSRPSWLRRLFPRRDDEGPGGSGFTKSPPPPH